MRLYAAFLGLDSQPQPLGALKPSECRTYRLSDKRAAIRLRNLKSQLPEIPSEIQNSGNSP